MENEKLKKELEYQEEMIRIPEDNDDLNWVDPDADKIYSKPFNDYDETVYKGY